MRRLRIATIVVSCAFLALAPSLAEAAAGNSRSQGSRGSRTYEAPSGTTAKPMERSVTPREAPRQPQYVPRPAPAAPVGGGFFSRHPFMTGLLGGFVGAGLAGMLFGHSAYAADASPMGSMLGLLLQLALIGGLVYLGFRLFRRRVDPSASSAGQATYYTAEPVGSGMAAGAGQAVAGPPVSVTDADYAAFGDLLSNIQGAWTRSDLAELKRYVTPEMLSYFAEELSRNASQGLENRVENVTLVKGDLLEAWQEDGLEYVTAQMRWSAFDYMVRADRSARDPDYVASGTPAQAVEHAEVWTFVRSRGGHWLLSAIQQTN
jgi:predicted lipid-binding transport protein (Tim44 family)